MTVGELREFILESSSEEIENIRDGLTAEVIAGVAKLMSNLDLVVASKKLTVTATCNTTIGLPGTLASRLQPNHPTDSVQGVMASVFEGISYASGDAMIGLNPAVDTVEQTDKILYFYIFSSSAVIMILSEFFIKYSFSFIVISSSKITFKCGSVIRIDA